MGLDLSHPYLLMLGSAVGAGYFIYGKKQAEAAYLACGLALMLIVGLLPGFWLEAIATVALVAAPFLLR